MKIIESIAAGILGRQPAPRVAATPDTPRVETTTIVVNTKGLFGPSRELRHVRRLLEQGWVIVSQTSSPFGVRETTYVLTRTTGTHR